jgi:hypothetical protein
MVIQVPKYMWRIARIELLSEKQIEHAQVCIQVFKMEAELKLKSIWSSQYLSNSSSQEPIVIEKSQMVDHGTGKSLFNQKDGTIGENDLLLISAHTIKEKELFANIVLELIPGRDRDEIDTQLSLVK